MKRAVVALVSLLTVPLAVSSVQAADLPPGYAAPIAAAPIYNSIYRWSGFYLGINGGGAWGRSQWDGVDKFNVSGGLIGGTVGYNWQFGTLLAGLEGDIDWSGVSGSTNVFCAAGCSTRNHWLATARG